MNWSRFFWLLVGGLALGGLLQVYQDVTAPSYCKADVDLDVYKHRGDTVQVINQGTDAAGNVSVTTGNETVYLEVPGGTVQTVQVAGVDPVLGLVGCRGVSVGG